MPALTKSKGLSPGVPIDALWEEDLSNEATRAALKALDPRYYDQYYMLPSRISSTDIPFGATSSSPGMTDIYHGSRTPTWYNLPPVSEVGFETGRNEARLLAGNKPFVYATTEPDISQMLAEREGRAGTVIKGQVPTESLRGGISTVPGAFGGDPRYPNYDPETEAFIRSRGFDPRMSETELLLTPEDANKAFGFTEGTAKVAPRARVGPFDLGQRAAQQVQGARIPLSATLKGLLGVGKEYIGSAKDFLDPLKQKAITGAGTAARFLGPASIPLDLIAANQYFGKDQPARGVAALASTVFPPAILAELGLSAGASIQDAARQAGEYLTSPDQEFRTLDLPLVDQMGEYIANRGLYGPESLGENITDRTSQLTELASGVGTTDPNVMSQSAQALIKSFADDPSVASLVSRKPSMRDAVGEALDRFLPAAFGIRSAHATVTPSFDLDDPDQFERARSLHEIENQMRQEEQDSEVRKLLDKAKAEVIGDIDFDKKPRPRGMRPVRQPSAIDELMDLDPVLSMPSTNFLGEPSLEEARQFWRDEEFGTGTKTIAPMVDTFEDTFPTPEEGPGWFSRMMSSILPDVEAAVTADSDFVGLDPAISKTEFYGRRSDDIRFPYPETGFQGRPDIIDPGAYPSQDYGPTGENLGKFPTEPAFTHSFNDPDTQWQVLKSKASSVAGGNWMNKDVAKDLGAELGYDRPLNDAEYDAYVHLSQVAGQPFGEISRLGVSAYEGFVDPAKEYTKQLISKFPGEEPTKVERYNIPGLTDKPGEAIMDAINNMVADEYWNMSQATGEPIDVKEMFFDPRVITNLNISGDPLAEDPKDRPSHISALINLIGKPGEYEKDEDTGKEVWVPNKDYDAAQAADIVERYTTRLTPTDISNIGSGTPFGGSAPKTIPSPALVEIASQVEGFADIPKAPPSPKAVSRAEQKKAAVEQKKVASDQRKRDKKAAAKRQAADKRAADKAAAKSKAMSKAQKRNIAKAAKAARAAEAAREAATKKAAEDQRRKDKEAQKIWDMHKKMQEQNKEQRAREEARRLALGYGSGGMWT